MEPITVVTIVTVVVAGLYAMTREGAKSQQEAQPDENDRRANANRRLVEQWNAVSNSLWWKWGIPEKTTLVLDYNILNDSSPLIAFWIKMVQDNAGERNWNVAVLHSVYARGVKSDMRNRVSRRLSNLQDRLGERFRILPKPARASSPEDELAEYLLAEKTRADVFFTNSDAHKVIITEVARRCSVELAHEVRTPKNREEYRDFGTLYHDWAYKRSAFVDVPGGIDQYPANATFSIRDASLNNNQQIDLRRFVDWNIIKLNIVD